MGTSLNISNDAIDTAAGVAGLVANIVAPGSGAVVSKAVKAGAEVLGRIVGIFNKEKKSGKSDAAAAAAAAAVPLTAAEIAEVKKAAVLGDNVRDYLDNITPEDLRLSTLFKNAKMEAGEDNYPQIASDAIASGKIDGSLLGVYDYFYTGEANEYANTLGIGTGTAFGTPPSIGTGSTGTASAAASTGAAGSTNNTGGLRPGESEKVVNEGWAWGNFFAVLSAGAAAYIWFVSADVWARMAATANKRRLAAAKARKVKADNAKAKAPAKRKIMPKKQ